MAKFIVIEIIEEKTSDSFALALLAWSLFLWWIYMFYYMIYYFIKYVVPYSLIILKYLFIVPCIILYKGIKESDARKILIGGGIILFYIISFAVSLIITEINSNKFQLKGPDRIEIYFGEEYDYFSNIKVFNNGSEIENEITYKGQADPRKIGDYTISYSSTLNDKTIFKDVVISVVPFYDNPTHRINILEKIKVTKTSDNSYKFTGFISNYSYKEYKKFVLTLKCVETNTLFNISFDGLPISGITLDCDFTSVEPLSSYTYKVQSVVLY